MNDDKPLINKVEQSGLVVVNLEDFFPKHPIVVFDIKDYLYMELVLKEKDFRQALKDHNWSQYNDKILVVLCSADAIVPVWAYMLVAAMAEPFAVEVFAGSEERYLQNYYSRVIRQLDLEPYGEKRIVIKGCSNKPVPASAYAELTGILVKVALSVMYGEPCSTVPIYKKAKNNES